MFFDFKVIQKYINPFKYPKLALLVILSLGFMLRALKLAWVGIWTDEGVYLYEAWIVLEGKLPYRDFFKPKPLGMVYIISILFCFSGQNAIAARILTSLISLWTCFFLYLLGKEMYNQKVGIFAATFYNFDPLVILFSYHVYTETYVAFFLVLSAYFAVFGKKRGNLVYYLVSGIFVVLSFFMKQPGIIMTLIITIFIFYSPVKKESLSSRFLKFTVFFIGITLVLSLIFVYYFSIGLLAEFIYYNFTFHSTYTGSARTLWGRIGIIRYLILENIILWITGITAIPIFLKNRREVDIFILSFFSITFIALISFLTPYAHYFVQSTPPLCILAGYSLTKFFEIISESKIKVGKRYILLGAIVILTVNSLYLSSRSYIYARTNFASLEEQNLVAEYIKQRTSPDEYIFSSYPAYYFLAERQCPSKYIYLSLATLEVENVDFPDVLQVKKIRYVILTDAFFHYRYNEKIDAIIDYIETNYTIEKTFSFRKEIIFIFTSKSW
jgi:4-amino-4-deoxy-L-arabinose transferase-like glycosyltransferase